MARRQTATQAAIVRALKGAQAAGIKIARLEVDGDKIVIHSGDHAGPEMTPLEKWRASSGSR